MIFSKKVLCIVPAKKNSEGFKKKNFKKISSLPLYVHSIRNAINCKYIDKIAVSSDSQKILNYSKNNNIISIKRSKRLSSKNSEIKDVIFDVLNKIDEKFDILILLQPTTPIISQKELAQGLRLICKKKYSSIISILSGNMTIANLLEKTRNGLISNVIKKKYSSTNRQNYETYYTPSGDFFITKINNFKKTKSFYGKNVFGFETKNKFSVDINFKKDLEYLNFLIKKK